MVGKTWAGSCMALSLIVTLVAGRQFLVHYESEDGLVAVMVGRVTEQHRSGTS